MSDQGYGGTYGDPQYPSDPQGRYGQYGQYGGPPGGQYAGQYGPGYGAPPPPPPSGSGQRGLFLGLGAVIVAGLVVLVLAVTGVFSGNSTTADGPKQVVEKVLVASKKQNLDDVKAVVCKKDLSDPDLSDIVGKDHATSYSVGSVTRQAADRASVDVRVTTSNNGTDSTKLAVVKEDGKWKVCFSETGNTSASPSTSTSTSLTPSPNPTGYSLPTTFNSCATGTTAAETAKTFISFITLSLTTLADDCVYQGRVTTAQLQALTGDVYSPTQNDGQPGPQFVYKSAQGTSTITLTVEKQSDGRYYVTAASKS